jgi:C-terminal processing protease CtpA/Prc
MISARRKAISGLLGPVLLLTGCGDGGGGSAGGGGGFVTPTPTPTSGAGNSACTLDARQSWALAQMREWYLFPETLPASINGAAYPDVARYVDALTATARAQGRDRYFTYVTSIAAEDAYYDSGESAGLGIRIKIDAGARRAWVSEALEGTPGFAAGLDRGTELLAVGLQAGNLRQVTDILATQGESGLAAALGPDTSGTIRALRVRDLDGTERVVTLTKETYELRPVSPRYGARVIQDGDTRIGYLNLRTFITTADPALRRAFADFQVSGIDQLIVDLRYNGGGLVSTAALLANLLGGNRRESDIQTTFTFRPDKASENETIRFAPQPESMRPRRIAFIGFEGTASASELVINAMLPYLHADVALIGGNTYGKPVGQIAVDRTACDDRLRIIAFAGRNAAGNGDYYSGLASSMEATCRAGDDLTYPLGDPRESSVRAALDYLAGRGCTPILAAATQGARPAALTGAGTRLLVPERPTTPQQREVPGMF